MGLSAISQQPAVQGISEPAAVTGMPYEKDTDGYILQTHTHTNLTPSKPFTDLQEPLL